MFNQTRWSRCALLLVVGLTVALSDGSWIGRSQVVGPTAPAPILTGKWKLDTGETIDITQTASGVVTAKFSPVVPCWDLPRTFLLSGKLKSTGTDENATVTIENGRFWACTRTEKMWRECPTVAKLFETKIRNVTVSPYSITGEVLRPGYYLPDGDFRRCRPDSTYEGWEQFTLAPLCRPSTAWFDKGGSCQDAQEPVITINQRAGSLSICGFVVDNFTDPDLSVEIHEAYARAVKTDLIRQIGSKVCCQAFREAVRTGQPCNPLQDLDCDGKPNLTDVRIESNYEIAGTTLSDIRFLEINPFSTPPGASVHPFPTGLNPDDPGFVPNSNGCDCKWSLIKGELNCGTGGQGHSYVATWQCPTTGREVTTRKNASPNTPCP